MNMFIWSEVVTTLDVLLYAMDTLYLPFTQPYHNPTLSSSEKWLHVATCMRRRIQVLNLLLD